VRSASRLAAPAVAALLSLFAAAAHAQDASVVVHLLDYIAVDYSGAVADGKVKSAEEYSEMNEFAAHVATGLDALAPNAAKAGLQQGSAALRKLVADKAAPEAVTRAASELRQKVVAAYRVAVGPRRAPDLGRAALLFSEHCSGCHGATGLGNGALAKGLDPQPANFHDAERQRARSVHGLYNTLTLGVGGTSMRAFKELSDDDRWALAYLTANWGATPEQLAQGKALWEASKPRTMFTDQAAIAGRSPADVAAAGGAEAVALQAYLRANPALVEQGKPDPVSLARDKLAESVELYRRGSADAAFQAALSAYLDGFELAETGLRLVDEDLMRRIEAAMIEYRNALKAGAPHAQVETMARDLDDSLREAHRRMNEGGLSPWASFLASFVILLREGLEAVLVVVALAAFLRRSGQDHAMPYLHAGWIAALLLGALTWYVATRVIESSGASRELTEGVAALAAAAMLVYVGYWLHDKSHAQAWQGFVMSGAKSIGTGAAWGLAFMAFLAVYREVFETVLFYETLWAQAPDRGAAIVAGFGAGLAALGALTWAMLRFSIRLPLGLFFGASGILLAVLAVVLAGNGIAALQEAGVIPITPVAFVTVGWLGIHPNVQALGAQALLAVLTAVLLFASRRR